MDNQNQNTTSENQQIKPNVQNGTQFTYNSRNSSIRNVEKISAWALIFSAVLFAFIAILSIWGAFGSNNSISWKAVASLGIIAITSLVVNIGARIYEGKKK